MKAMEEVGIDISSHTSKDMKTFGDLSAFDAVVTLCAEEICPLVPKEKHLDWAVEDPAGDFEGETEEQKLQRFRVARDAIEKKMDAYIAHCHHRDSSQAAAKR